MAKVSVIIPTYNRLASLKRAIASVLRQSFKDFDVWIVDDASTDETLIWLQELQTTEPRIECIFNKQNLGVSASRNLAIHASTSEWIALLDSDDEWSEDKLERQFQFASLQPDCPLIHTEEIWIRNGVRVNPMKKHKKLGGQIFEHCFELCRISPSASLFQRKLIEELGDFRQDFPVCEDFEFWLRVTRHYPVGFLNETLTLKYGGHEDQLSRKYHSMDYWRVKALMPYLEDPLLPSQTKNKLIQTATKKCEILLKGYEKHQNLKDVNEVSLWLKRLQNSV